MSRYVINILASEDLNAIADYFAENNLEAGERFFREFNRKCQQLVAFPNSGKATHKFVQTFADCPLKVILFFTES
ncbi:type II toxin-antitoxin system RelE/ParE family toxin [Aerosakkonemataceae cyanobacterium BLCC-F154]|uniref:Type II toxin-antitoxin system RelE/ParE family toxin n=1 Tax=Floridaenema fluviatile BLCC-F154 TaxID=3153640 RepID=A0ABV4Y934_9CYAN